MKIIGNINVNGNIIENENYYYIFNNDSEKQESTNETSNQQEKSKDNANVKPEPAQDMSVNKQAVPVKETATPQQPLSNVPPTTLKDFSHSPLIAYMTYPEHANYLLGWLHYRMDDKIKKYRDYFIPFRAAYEKGLFKSNIPYKYFEMEFGNKITQSFYSRLMGKSANYTDDEISLALEGLNLNVFYTNSSNF